MPAYNDAIAALNTLDRQDITQVKSMTNPPNGVKITMQALCIMRSVPPKMVPNENGVGKRPDYWEVAKTKVLQDTRLLQKLQEYDKDNIDPKIITQIEPFMKDRAFEPEVIKKASKAAYGICKWVRAMHVYDQVAKVVRPKREQLVHAEGLLKAAEETLALRQKSLQDVLDLL